ALDVDLAQREPVVVASGKIADVERHAGEPRDLGGLSLRKEPIGDSTLIEDLDGARVQAPRARAGEVLVRATLDDRYVHPRQPQLARQHQSRRTSTGDHHSMLGHLLTPVSARSGNGGRCCAMTRVLPQAHAALYSESARERALSCPSLLLLFLSTN